MYRRWKLQSTILKCMYACETRENYIGDPTAIIMTGHRSSTWCGYVSQMRKVYDMNSI